MCVVGCALHVCRGEERWGVSQLGIYVMTSVGGHIRRQKLKPNGETKAGRGCEFYGAWRVCVCVCVCVCVHGDERHTLRTIEVMCSS